MIRDKIYLTRKAVLLRGRFFQMKTVLQIQLVILFHGAYSVTYLETSPLKLISATQSSTFGNLGADLAIDEDFATSSHTNHQLAPWIRVQFQEGIVSKVVVYNRLVSKVIDR